MRARESLDCGVPAGLLLVESMAPSSSSPDRRSSQFRLPPPRSSEATLDFGPRRRWWRGGGGSSSFRGHGRCQKPPTFPSAAAHTVVGFSLSPFLEATPAATVIDAFFPFQALLLAWGSFVRAMTNSLFPATSILFKSRD